MKKTKSLSVSLFLCFSVALAGCEGTEPSPLPSEPEPAPAPECAEASDCGAGYPDCYAWMCAEGECVHELDNGRCSEGYECRPLLGCMLKYPEPPEPNCEINEDCFSSDCIVGECQGGRCFSGLYDALCLPDETCDPDFGVCVRGDNKYWSRCHSDGDCDDGDRRTRDSCAISSGKCIHIPF